MKKYVTRDHFWLAMKYLFIALVFGFIIRGFLLIPIQVTGNSMEKTLRQGDMIVLEKYTQIKRFDVIVFKKSDGTTYIKRVVGLPGEKIAYHNDRLLVNDQPVAEPFLKQNQKQKVKPYTPDFTLVDVANETQIPQKNYFVLGDNRRISKDSRSFGTVEASEILGKARFVYYPLTHAKIISHH